MNDKAALQYVISEHFRIKCWSDQCVAFHIFTGKTHLLQSLPAVIVDTIYQHPSIPFNHLVAKLRDNDLGMTFSPAIIDTYLRQLQISNIIESIKQ